MITRGSDDITWYSFDLPKKIESGTKTTEFWYGPDRARYQQELATSGTPDAIITYAGLLFEFEDAATDTYRHYVQAGDKVIAVVERVGTTNTKQFLHRDHQGSVVKVTDASGSLLQALAFDAWGLRRDASNWSALGSPFAGSHETERGYTGHEHLDTVGLIHMNGRVQDPILGRFISADPLIQSPYSTQSHNRYSYVWNNPVSLTDPSGFCTEEDGWTDCSYDVVTVTASRPSGDCDWACIRNWMEQMSGLMAALERASQEMVGAYGPRSNGGNRNVGISSGSVPNGGAEPQSTRSTFGGAATAAAAVPGSTLTAAESREALGVAWWALNEYNPMSVANNREYAGLVYQDASGNFIATEAIAGAPCTATGCGSSPWAALSLVPCGRSCVVLDYHTHGPGGAGLTNEYFSGQLGRPAGDHGGINADGRDPANAAYLGAVLGTPGGESYFYPAGALCDTCYSPASMRSTQVHLQSIAK